MNIMLPLIATSFLFSAISAWANEQPPLDVLKKNAGLSTAPCQVATRKFLGICWAPNSDYGLQGTLFNQVTPENSGKWGVVEKIRGTRDWRDFNAMVDFAVQHKMLVKHHTFVWGMQQPGWSTNAVDMKDALDTMMDDFFKRFGDKVDMIDVVNESQAQPAGYREQFGGAGETGWDWVLYVFRRARFHGDKYGYKGAFILNEIGIENNGGKRKNVCKIIGLLKKENLIDGIGVQGHFLEKLPVEKVKLALDELAETGVPLYISEFDVNEADDQQQLEKFSALFKMYWEHPAVKGVTLWGINEGKMWRKQAFLVRKDGSERPAMTWLKSYIK